MNTSTTLLTHDEATVEVVEALDDVTAILRHRRPHRTINALLENRACRSRLDIDEEHALHKFRSTVAVVAASGHRWIISDQIDGYLSALAADPAFTSASTRHFQEM